MTSKAATRCFIYITLPGQTKPVTAGRFDLTVDRGGSALGTFVYGRSYLARSDAVALDPVELKLANRPYQTPLLHGVFGALRDAGPDHWGRLIIERALKAPALSELDYLINSPDDRAGALAFGLNETPPAPNRVFNQTLDLARLQATARAIVNDETKKLGPEAEQIERLMLLGTSMGGARPKAVVEDADGLWVAKFNKPTDRWNMARVEHAMLLLAQHCGLTVAQSKVETVAGQSVLLVKRFDRTKVRGGYQRARMVSALTLLRADESDKRNWSYVALAEELRRSCTNPKQNAAELFRRMCFNALISNTDDHPRNHAIIAPDQHWQLSPAYDLTPATPISREHRDLAMICGDFGRYASAQNMLSQARRFLLAPAEAAAIVREMEDRVRADWHSVARKAGVTVKDCKAIASAFVYEGFSFAL